MKLGCKPSKLDGTEAKYEAQKGLKIPASYTYQPYLSAVLNQGQTNTCVPYSISAHLNWNRNITAKTNKVDNGVNIKELYDVREDRSSDNGMTIKEALHYLYKHGVSSKVGSLKIRKYAKVGGDIALKQAILMNGPCIAALPVYNDTGAFWLKRYGDTFLGGHAICIVGWNNDGFIIRNSWGQSWNKQGYTTIKYDDFKSFYEIWTIID